jgi:hypothetical protein
MLRHHSTAAALALPLPNALHLFVLRRWFRPRRRPVAVAPLGRRGVLTRRVPRRW